MGRGLIAPPAPDAGQQARGLECCVSGLIDFASRAVAAITNLARPVSYRQPASSQRTTFNGIGFLLGSRGVTDKEARSIRVHRPCVECLAAGATTSE